MPPVKELRYFYEHPAVEKRNVLIVPFRNGIRAEGCFQHVRHQLSPRYDMDMLLAFPCPNPRQRGRRSRTFRASVKVGGVESAGKHEANLSSGL